MFFFSYSQELYFGVREVIYLSPYLEEHVGNFAQVAHVDAAVVDCIGQRSSVHGRSAAEFEIANLTFAQKSSKLHHLRN